MEWPGEFPQRDDVIYLNHAAVAPWPRRAAEAVKRFADENVAQGALDYAGWLKVEGGLREQLRALINAPSPDDIALLKNTSEALSVVAYGIDWKAGDNIITSDQEFPSNRIVWESLRNQGVELREADLAGGVTPEDALMARVDRRTRLLTISSVQYASGLRMDLKRLGAFCREHDILFCVDAIQSLGAVQFDVQEINADFVMADGHKWMLGPEGLALFYCRAALRDGLRLYQYGWHNMENPGDYDRRGWQVARSARRFECGSPNLLGIHALSASLSLLAEIGMPEIERKLVNKITHLYEEIEQYPDIFELLTPPEEDRRAGIVTFRHRHADPARLLQYLRNQGVVCALRGGGIRFSPHFYTPREQIDRALASVLGFK